jgi:hypothetical protein
MAEEEKKGNISKISRREFLKKRRNGLSVVHRGLPIALLNACNGSTTVTSPRHTETSDVTVTQSQSRLNVITITGPTITELVDGMSATIQPSSLP